MVAPKLVFNHASLFIAVSARLLHTWRFIHVWYVQDWIRDNRPEDYERTTYTCIEVSSRLAVQQYQTVVAKGGHVGRFRLLRGSGWDVETWGERDYTHTFILMMEVLDNLPHDR